jgi:1A family penicillin-binding protein
MVRYPLGMHRHHKKRPWHHIFLWLLGVGLATGLFMVSGLLLWASTLDLPDFSVFNERKVAESTKIFDRNGILLYDVYKDVRRTVVPFDQISINIKNASIAIEDDKFYEHHGVRPLAFIRALIANFKTGKFGQGGSTITQQVIKNALLTREKTISRKVKEWILAIKLERSFSKEDILSLYLNESPYGGTIYGVEETSLAFFGKSAKDVTLAEAAYLAALPQAPSYYSPYGKNKAGLDDRKNLVLRRMKELGFITPEEYEVAKAEVVRFIPIEDRSIKAPHFVMYVKEELTRKYGEDALVSGGLRVTTTLDYALQEQAQNLVSTYMDENDERFNAGNGALVATDPKTGQILVMVGSRDYFDQEREGNFNIATAKRQPGSAFKPFVYAKAFEKGYTPETVLFDLPTQFNANCDAFGKPLTPSIPESACYMPENYDQTFRGPITLRDALAQSINIPAIKTLYLVGIKPAIEFAQRLGVTGLDDPNRYGLTLVLGGGEVSLLDLVSAYSVFANDGKRNPTTGILKVENRDGEVLEEFTSGEQPIIDADIARQISDVLSDDTARAPAFGANSFLSVPGKSVAVKTGTTNDYRDVWIVGYTPSLAVGAWMGNNDNTPMQKRVAGFIVAPMWNAFMKMALEKKDNEPFEKPFPISSDLKPVLRGIWSGGQTFFIDTISQKLATPETPDEFKQEKVIPNVHEILYWVDKNDPRGPAPTHPEEDSQFSLWEIPVQLWAQNQPPSDQTVILPTSYDDVHRAEFAPTVKIQSPVASSTLSLGEKVFVITEITSTYPVRSVDISLGGKYLGTSQKAPYLFSFIPSDLGIGTGTTTLEVLVTDSIGNKKEASIPLSIVE